MNAVHTTRHSGEHTLLNPHPARPEEVLVFKTSGKSRAQVDMLRHMLDLTITGNGQWNFDLEDRDRILRVEAGTMVRERIMALLSGLGFACDELE